LKEEIVYQCKDQLRTMQRIVRINSLSQTIADDITNSVFQSEYNMILKQIALDLNQEMNQKNEKKLTKLAQLTYFGSDESEETSMYNQHLRQFTHECIFEYTRLNLNVNRELYFEIQLASGLCHQKFIFRQWRLKLSLLLIKKAEKRNNLSSSSSSSSLKRKSNFNNDSTEHDIHLFMINYCKHLITNMNRLHNLLPLMLQIVHCEQFLMHLAWNIPINFNSVIFNILYDNYFNIVHNREEDVVIQSESLVKTVLALPKLVQNSKSSGEEEEEAAYLNRWLTRRFLHFNKQTNNYKIEHLEEFFLPKSGCHQRDASFGLDFCLKMCRTRLTTKEYNEKRTKRSLYGANSLIFVLFPLKNDVIYLFFN
jgi:hypothetical protein